MKRVRLTSAADRDYLQAVAWYEEQQAGLGREFEVELERLFARIKDNPEQFPRATLTVRKALLPRFHHGIFFTVEADEIGVVAIYHPSRDPAALRRRL